MKCSTRTLRIEHGDLRVLLIARNTSRAKTSPPIAPSFRPLGNRAVSAYADLVRLPKDDEIVGSPKRVVRGSSACWYDACRLGGASKKRYLGAELLARIEAWRALADARKERDLRRAQLVRVLRAEGMTPMDRETGSVLAAKSRAGASRLGGVLVGTAAVRFSLSAPAVLAARASDETLIALDEAWSMIAGGDAT